MSILECTFKQHLEISISSHQIKWLWMFFLIFINNFFRNSIHGKTYFSPNIFRRKWSELGNQMNNGIAEISAKAGNCSKGIKNYSMKVVTTFVLKSILDTQRAQRLPWLPPPPGSASSWQCTEPTLEKKSPSGHLEPEKGSETSKLNSWGETLSWGTGWGNSLKQAGFLGTVRSFTLFSTQVNCLNNQRGLSCQETVCPQLISWTANKSTNTNAPVTRPKTKPEWCCG